MAVIPRYFSQRDAVPAINNVRMDPGTAAAPYKAAEQSNNQMLEIFQHELGAWGKVLAVKQAEQQAAEAKNKKIADSLYKAEAMAQLSIGSNEIHNKTLQTSDGTTNHANIADQEFQQLVDQAIANAPSDEARIDITKRAIGMRANLYNRTTNDSIKANNQVNMDRIEGMLGQYEAYASNNPALADEVKKQAEDVFNSMAELGLPPIAQQKIRSKFTRNVDYQAAASMAEKDPMAVKEALGSGQFNHLGANAVKKLGSVAEHSLKASTKQAKEALVDVEKGIMAGRPLPDDFEARAQLASKLGLQTELEDIKRLTDVATSISAAKLPEIVATGAELKALIAKGEIDLPPAKAEKLVRFVESRAKALKSDPFQFATNQGSFKPFNTITDFTNVSPDELQQRKYRSLQIEDAYGVKSPAISNDELNVALTQLDSAAPDQKAAILQTLGSLGEETLSRATQMADKKKDLGLSQAIRMSSIDPETATIIAQGREVLKGGAHKFDSAELKDAKAQVEKLALDSTMRQASLSAAKAYQAANPGQPLSDLVKKANNIIDIDRNGWFTGQYSTIAPAAGMGQKEFETLVDSGLGTSSAWTSFGTGIPAQTQGGKALAMNRFKPSDFDYVYKSDGTYGVRYEGEEVYDSTGRPVSVDLIKLNKQH